MTLEQGFKRYLKKCQVKNLSETSLKNYRIKVGDFIAFAMPDRKLSEVNVELVDDYILHLKDNESLNDVSIVSHMKCIKAFLNFLMDNGFIEEFKIVMPKAEKKEIEPYSKEDILALLAAPQQDAKKKEIIGYTFINFLLGTGVRLGTAINVKISDIDFESGFIHLDKTKSRKEYSVPLADKLAEILKSYIEKFNLTDNDFLFSNLQGKKANERCYQRIVQWYNTSRGVKCTKCHTFRHTFAKEYILAGGDVFRLQKILGHADIKTTSGYINMFSQDLKRDFDKFNVLDMAMA